MTKLNRLLVLSASSLSLLIAGQSSAQQTLLEIYELARTNDPALRQAEANYLAQAETRPQARSSLLPTIQLGANTSTSHSENPNPPLDFETNLPSDIFSSSEFDRDADSLSLSLNQTIFNWGSIVQLRQADKVVARAETDYRAAEQDLMIRVAVAYFNVLAAEDQLAAQGAARESIARQLEQAQRRFEVGLTAITDVQEAQAGFDNAVANEIAAERVLATNQEFLREIIGESVTELVAPGDDLPLLRPDPADPEDWVRTAMQQNLVLVSSRIAVEIAQDDIRIQRSGRFPTLNLQGSVSDQTSTTEQTTNLFAGPSIIGAPATSVNEGFNFSLNLSVPLYTGGLNRSRVQQAVYQHRATREGLELVARQTERQTRDMYLGVISEISRVQALRQAVESAQTALRAIEAGFEVGTRTTVDVLDAQNLLRQQQTTYARARYDYVLNALGLKQAAGTLAEEDLVEVDGWLGN